MPINACQWRFTSRAMLAHVCCLHLVGSGPNATGLSPPAEHLKTSVLGPWPRCQRKALHCGRCLYEGPGGKSAKHLRKARHTIGIVCCLCVPRRHRQAYIWLGTHWASAAKRFCGRRRVSVRVCMWVALDVPSLFRRCGTCESCLFIHKHHEVAVVGNSSALGPNLI